MQHIENTPYFSVIIPTYNRANYIGDCINSVLNQTFQDFEILIVDDGSTDNTHEIVNRIRDNRISYQKIDNSGGPATPRNIAIKSAKGQIISFLDSDDLWLPTKLEKQKAIFENKKVDFVYSYATSFNHDGDKESIIKYRFKRSGNLFFWLLFYAFIPTLTVSVKKEVFAKCGLFDETLSLRAVEDYDLWLRMASNNISFGFINEPLAKYRLHDEQISYNILGDLDKLKQVLLKHKNSPFPYSYFVNKALSKLELRKFKYFYKFKDEVKATYLLKAFKIDFTNLTALILYLIVKLKLFFLLKGLK